MLTFEKLEQLAKQIIVNTSIHALLKIITDHTKLANNYQKGGNR